MKQINSPTLLYDDQNDLNNCLHLYELFQLLIYFYRYAIVDTKNLNVCEFEIKRAAFR